jgi:exocyst complex component 1
VSEPQQQQSYATGNELALPKHNMVHKELSAYSDLMHWMKIMDRKSYDGLAKIYTSSLSKVYERDIRLFFDQVSGKNSVDIGFFFVFA